jgi:hypothetical protein
MRNSVAWQRYLQRHIEAHLPAAPSIPKPWQNVLVIPAYRESAALLTRLKQLPEGKGQTLVILVLNQPDTERDPTANKALRTALEHLRATTEQSDGTDLYTLNRHANLYVHDMETLGHPLPTSQGVGLARKTGCDIAIKWMHAGAISGVWIHNTDADAELPADYFQRPENACEQAIAAIYPFRHIPGADRSCDEATALYELRLHHYVLGLEYAGSPYAHHTLGSCVAVKAEAYTQVRGFPKRAGGEDFYLLNKLVKLGPLVKLQGKCIELRSRHSTRVPFGTGPAVARIASATHPMTAPLFYHPACFEALRALLCAAPSLRQQPYTELPNLLQANGLEQPAAVTCSQVLETMGLEVAIAHCRKQGKTPEQFLRQFHQWFDAFRSLKLIHALRDAGWPMQSLAALGTLAPQLWPTGSDSGEEIQGLRSAVNQHWGWLV